MPTLRLAVVLLVASLSFAQSALPQANEPETPNAPLTAAAIMARVAASQDSSEALRKEYVYLQHTHVVTHKPKGGRLQREETADYDVTPTPDGTQKKLKWITVRYWQKGKYETFEADHAPEGEGDGIDGSLVKSFRDDLLDDKSKDGLAKNLFPLTSEQQKDYNFTLLGQEMQDGRSVYHIGFRPKDKNDISWAGEAYIDAAEFQPVRVFTKLSRRLPFAVRTLLGTDVPGIGFNVVYKRQEDGVWFPSTFGTEFRLHAVFFINRDISVSCENSGFQRTHVESKMKVIGPVE
jgi:hypothetical protein